MAGDEHTLHDNKFAARCTRRREMLGAALVGGAPHDSPRSLVVLALLARILRAALLGAVTLHHPRQGLRLDALLAPLRASLLELGARRLERRRALPERLAQPVEK